MRIDADRDTCEGLGMGEAMSELFEMGDDGVIEVLDHEPPGGQRGDMRADVDACPVLVLKLVG